MQLEPLTKTSNNQVLTTSEHNLELVETDIPIDQPGISPIAYNCNYCGDSFYVKGAFCSSKGQALNCFRYKKK